MRFTSRGSVGAHIRNGSWLRKNEAHCRDLELPASHAARSSAASSEIVGRPDRPQDCSGQLPSFVTRFLDLESWSEGPWIPGMPRIERANGALCHKDTLVRWYPLRDSP